MTTLLPALAVATAASLLSGCGSSTPHVPAPELLQKAKVKADGSSAVHFVLSSSGVDMSGTNIVSGEGDLVRPESLQGSFDVTVSGFTAKVQVVSVGAVFEALTPFATKYVKTDPSKFGLTNPTELLSPTNGLTSLLAEAQNPVLDKTERLNGELLEQVTFTVPGNDIPVLPDADPSKPVTLTVAISPSSFEMRQITLVGPLTSATSNSTYTLTITKYGEHVNITLPATS